MYNEKPIWSFIPNWDEGITETLEWLTDVLASETGIEQRIKRRATPRRSFDIKFGLEGGDRSYFDMFHLQNAPFNFLMPLYHDVTTTQSAAGPGNAIVYVDTYLREYVAGGYMMFRGPTALSSEVCQIGYVGPNYLQLIAPPEKAWPINTIVYPMILARLDGDVAPTKLTDRLMEFRAKFISMQPNPYGAKLVSEDDGPTGTINQRPDESEDLTFTYTRLMQSLDNAYGIPVFVDRTNYPGVRTYIPPTDETGVGTYEQDTYVTGVTLQQHRWGMIGREQNARLRRWLYYFAGRLRTMMLPTFMQDLIPVYPIRAGDTALIIENIGWSRYGKPLPGREIVRIELRDGEVRYAAVTEGNEIDDYREIVTLSAKFYEDLTPDDFISISWCQPFRLDQDSVEIFHDTDVDGLSRVTLAFRSQPQERFAADYHSSQQWTYGCGVAGLITSAVSIGTIDSNLNDTFPMVPASYNSTLKLARDDAWFDASQANNPVTFQAGALHPTVSFAFPSSPQEARYSALAILTNSVVAALNLQPISWTGVWATGQGAGAIVIPAQTLANQYNATVTKGAALLKTPLLTKDTLLILQGQGGSNSAAQTAYIMVKKGATVAANTYGTIGNPLNQGTHNVTINGIDGGSIAAVDVSSRYDVVLNIVTPATQYQNGGAGNTVSWVFDAYLQTPAGDIYGYDTTDDHFFGGLIPSTSQYATLGGAIAQGNNLFTGTAIFTDAAGNTYHVPCTLNVNLSLS